VDDQWSDEFIGPVDLGNPTEFSIHELAQILLELTRSNSRIVYRPLSEDDPQRRQPEISLARQRLGWEPVVPLRAGLETTIEWFSQVDWDDYRAPTPNH